MGRNEYACLLACVDTAENELLEVLFKIVQYYSVASLMEVPAEEQGREEEGEARGDVRVVLA